MRKILRRITPGYILAGGIILGFIFGLIGDQFPFCSNPSLLHELGITFSSTSECLSSPYAPTATTLLAQQNYMVYYLHSYWQLFTSIFVTDSYTDAAFNAIAVLVLDFFLPDTFNKTRYFAIFFFSAILGNLLTLSQGSYASAGASGGIFGIFAAAFAYNWAENKRVDFSTLTLFLVLFVGSSFLPGENVNWVAHLGGSIGGFIAGPLLYFSIRDNVFNYDINSKSLLRNRLILIGVILFMIVGSVIQFLLFVI